MTDDIAEVKQQPNPLLIKELKDLVVRAESGEIQGMVFFSIFDDGRTTCGWEPPPGKYHTRLVSRRFIGEIEYAKLELMSFNRWVERGEIFG